MIGAKLAMKAVTNQITTMSNERADAEKRICALKAEIVRRSVEIEAASDALVAKMEAV